MKLWMKVTIVCICGGVVWGLSYLGSIYPAYALVTSSFATGITALSSLIAGWPPKTEV